MPCCDLASERSALCSVASVVILCCWQHLHTMSGASHQHSCLWEGKILLMLQIHDWLNTVNQVLLSFLPKTFCLCLTFLGTVFMHTASCFLARMSCHKIHIFLSVSYSLILLCSTYFEYSTDGVKRKWTIANLCQPSPRYNAFCLSVSNLSSVVTTRKPLSTTFTIWQNKSSANSPR